MDTKKAFEHLISQRGWYKQCGINPDTARSLKRHNKTGMVTEGRMIELLRLAGYKETPAVWKQPI